MTKSHGLGDEKTVIGHKNLLRGPGNFTPISVKQVKNASVLRRVKNYEKADFDSMRSMLSCSNL